MHILAQILTIPTQFVCTNQACKLCYLIRSSDFHWIVGVWVSQLGSGQKHWMPTWRRGMQETRKGKRQLLIDGTNLTKTNLPLNLTMPKKSSYKQSHWLLPESSLLLISPYLVECRWRYSPLICCFAWERLMQKQRTKLLALANSQQDILDEEDVKYLWEDAGSLRTSRLEKNWKIKVVIPEIVNIAWWCLCLPPVISLLQDCRNNATQNGLCVELQEEHQVWVNTRAHTSQLPFALLHSSAMGSGYFIPSPFSFLFFLDEALCCAQPSGSHVQLVPARRN